jgi:prepilin-type N-terminal cleavage/methylation domain-containing protein
MKTHHRTQRAESGTSLAFTIIELLVVISVIALLAALTFPATRAAKVSMMRARARGELVQIQTAIERYKDKLGYYPPDNPTSLNGAVNQLYYELFGTTNANNIYHTLDDSAQISAAAVSTTFGPSVTGFLNCARPTRGDDAPTAVAFLKNLKPSQFLAITNGTPGMPPVCTVLGSALDGPLVLRNASGTKINPWRYNSSSPRYNPKSYDLWIDVMAGDKTNRISNWSDRFTVVGP